MDMRRDPSVSSATGQPGFGPTGGADPARRPVLIAFGLYLALGAATFAFTQWLLPEQLTLHLSGHAVTLKELHRRILTTWFMMVMVVPGIFIAELFFGGWEHSSLRELAVKRSRSSMSDLACFLCGQGRVMLFITVIFSFGAALISGAWLHQKLKETTGFAPSLEGLAIPVQMLIAFVIYTFFDYWNHRLNHTRYFWPLHRYHHSAEEFCVLTSVRSHPAVFTDVVATTLPPAVLSISPEAIVYVNLFVVVLRYVIHSRIDSDFGWVGRWVIQSPIHHRLHHVLVMTRPTANFALTPLWDRLFGTFRPEGDQQVAIGVDTPYRHGAWFLPDMWRDYCDFWKGLTRIGRPATAPSPAE